MAARIYPEIMSERRFWATPASACFMGNSVDEDILPFLKKLNSYDWIVSTSCCSGHGDEDAYVALAVKAVAISKLVRLLNRLEQHLDAEDVYISCELNYQNEVATSCDFENFPDWLMFHLDFYPPEGFATDAEFWERLKDHCTLSRKALKAA